MLALVVSLLVSSAIVRFLFYGYSHSFDIVIFPPDIRVQYGVCVREENDLFHPVARVSLLE